MRRRCGCGLWLMLMLIAARRTNIVWLNVICYFPVGNWAAMGSSIHSCIYCGTRHTLMHLELKLATARAHAIHRRRRHQRRVNDVDEMAFLCTRF